VSVVRGVWNTSSLDGGQARVVGETIAGNVSVVTFAEAADNVVIKGVWKAWEVPVGVSVSQGPLLSC
jgi:hypothetical protein